MTDATFEEGAEEPLRLQAMSPEDLSVLSTFVQDAVGQNSETSWMPKHRRFVLLLNRFRWEDVEAAKLQHRKFERVQSLLVVNSVLKVSAQGVDPKDKDLVFEVLGLTFEPADDGAGRLSIILAGDGAIALDVECLDVILSDQSRPYLARAQAVPTHPSE